MPNFTPEQEIDAFVNPQTGDYWQVIAERLTGHIIVVKVTARLVWTLESTENMNFVASATVHQWSRSQFTHRLHRVTSSDRDGAPFEPRDWLTDKWRAKLKQRDFDTKDWFAQAVKINRPFIEHGKVW